MNDSTSPDTTPADASPPDSAPPDTTRRPNVVLVITDQQRFDSINALGHDHVDTPHLDRLVAEGVAMTNAYVASPSCAPSRASLFTGLYPHTSGVLRNEDPWSRSWVQSLADSGYRCASVGKMHTYPYESYVGFHERHVIENKDRDHPTLPYFLDQWDKALWVRGLPKPSRVSYREREDYRERLGAFEWTLDEDMHADSFVGSLACHWLDTYPAREGEPFLLQVGFPGPHPPYDPPTRLLDRYRDREMPAPRNSRADIEAQPEPLQQLRRNHFADDHDAIVHLDDPSHEQTQRQRQHYYANVTLIDEQVGELVSALERRGVLQDTVIIFTSDHGDALNDHGHSQKWTMYEPSVHVPAIMWAPGRLPAGTKVAELVSLMDIGPTVLELAGLTPPEWMEARSLLPAMTGAADHEPRRYVFSEHARDFIFSGSELMTMVRDDCYKLVEFSDHEPGQLFDLHTDPGEEHDRWSDPELAGVRERLHRAIHRWWAQSAMHTATWAQDFR